MFESQKFKGRKSDARPSNLRPFDLRPGIHTALNRRYYVPTVPDTKQPDFYDAASLFSEDKKRGRNAVGMPTGTRLPRRQRDQGGDA